MMLALPHSSGRMGVIASRFVRRALGRLHGLVVPRLLAILTVLVGMSGCQNSLTEFAERWLEPEDVEFAQMYMGLWYDGQTDSAFALLAPELQTDTTQIVLETLVAFMRGRSLDSLTPIGIDVNRVLGGARHVNLSYQAFDGTQYLATNVATRWENGEVVVEGFSARPLAGSLFELHAFTWSGKSALHYLWVALACLMMLTSVGTAVWVAAARGMRRRWLWAPLALMAGPTYALDWTTGATAISSFSWVFFGAGLVKAGPAAPWILTFGMPTGAIVAGVCWLLWKRTASAKAQSTGDDG